MLIAGNWKMYKGPGATREFCAAFQPPGGVEAVLCPPFGSLGAAVTSGHTVYAQNVHWADEGGVLEERPVRDRTVYTLKVLVEDAARADRQMTDLGVAHLAVRQSDRLAGGVEGRVRVARPEGVEHRRLGQLDPIPRAWGRAAPPVEDDERYERDSRAAVSQIAVNDSTSSEAPPTRAPSTSGCASSSSAFSGFTEPP